VRVSESEGESESESESERVNGEVSDQAHFLVILRGGKGMLAASNTHRKTNSTSLRSQIHVGREANSPLSVKPNLVTESSFGERLRTDGVVLLGQCREQTNWIVLRSS